VLVSLVNIYVAWLIVRNGRQRNTTNTQIWGKVKWLELWWQLYVTWLPVRDLENFKPLDFCRTEGTLLGDSTCWVEHESAFMNQVCVFNWSSCNQFGQGFTVSWKIQEPPQNSRCRMGDMKNVPYWVPTAHSIFVIATWCTGFPRICVCLCVVYLYVTWPHGPCYCVYDMLAVLYQPSQREASG
jgi:hypothetical protein